MDVKKKLKLQKTGNIVSKSLTILFLTIMALVIIIPFYWMLNTSFKTAHEAAKEPPTLYPHEWNFQNYRIAFLGKKKVTLEKYYQEQKELPAKIDMQEKKVNSLKEAYIASKDKYESLEKQAQNDISIKYKQNYIDKYVNTNADGYSYHKYLENKDKYAILKIKLDDQLKILQNLKNELKQISSTAEPEKYKNKENEIKNADKKYDDIKQERKILSNYFEKFKSNFNTEQNEILKMNLADIYQEDFLKVYKPVFDYEAENNTLKDLKERYENELPKLIERKKEEKPDNFGRAMLNTIIVGISSTLIGTFLSIIGAFALSRLKFKGREVLFSIMMATMMIPGEMMVISNFITVTKAGWTDLSSKFAGASFFAMVVPFLVTVFHIYLLRQNFKQIPNELYYAAKVDGCTDFKYLWRVMVPLAKSSIITITILKVMGAWNAFIWPHLVAGTDTKLITVWLRTSFNDVETGRVLIETQMAATVIVLIPLLLVFIFLRKYIMRGVSRGGTKG